MFKLTSKTELVSDPQDDTARMDHQAISTPSRTFM